MMTPEEIKACLAEERNRLHAKPLDNPDQGYSFWYGAPAANNRILRASREKATSPTRLRLAVTHRLPDVKGSHPTEITFDGDRVALLSLVDSEIALYRARFEQS